MNHQNIEVKCSSTTLSMLQCWYREQVVQKDVLVMKPISGLSLDIIWTLITNMTLCVEAYVKPTVDKHVLLGMLSTNNFFIEGGFYEQVINLDTRDSYILEPMKRLLSAWENLFLIVLENKTSDKYQRYKKDDFAIYKTHFRKLRECKAGSKDSNYIQSLVKVMCEEWNYNIVAQKNNFGLDTNFLYKILTPKCTESILQIQVPIGPRPT